MIHNIIFQEIYTIISIVIKNNYYNNNQYQLNRFVRYKLRLEFRFLYPEVCSEVPPEHV